jgi:exo-beta-1,3-glucanase (GH17 family)
LTGNTITLSSSATFSDAYYSCALSSSSATKFSLSVNGQTTSSFTIQLYNNSGTSILGGTPLSVNYACSGN